MKHALAASIRASALVCLGFGAVAYASAASAACGDELLSHPASYQLEQGHGLSALLNQASADNPGNHAIVGMWSFKMTAGGNQVDFGYQQWHSDGTEFMNSGGRAPATQNFCLGVWRQVGAATDLNRLPALIPGPRRPRFTVHEGGRS